MNDPPSIFECPRCKLLEAQIAKLTARIEELERAGKRQAAPFRKKGKAKQRKKPGRKSGEGHGEHHRRAAPAPEQIDERHDVPLPNNCATCGSSRLSETHIAVQYQVDLPRQPIHRQFDIHIGCCDDCGARAQGRHELQTSDALGAAAVQLGPNVHAAMATLNKELGLSHGKVRRVLKLLFGIVVARATSARSTARTGRRCTEAYAQIQRDVRGSPQVIGDETGWRVDGRMAWLHAFVGQDATCYEIDPTRSVAPAERLLGMDWAGVLGHDGWSVYDKFREARHQQCLAHLLRRCQSLLETATGGAVRFPRAVKALLQEGLSVRDRQSAGELTWHGRLAMAGRLTSRLYDLVAPTKTHAANERLASFLYKHLDNIFLFLREPGVDATNFRAEQAIRPAVVNRKVWGGNRTWHGARTQSILTSVIRTCHQRLQEPFDYLVNTLTSPHPAPLPAPTR